MASSTCVNGPCIPLSSSDLLWNVSPGSPTAEGTFSLQTPQATQACFVSLPLTVSPSNDLFLILLIPKSLGSPTRVLPLLYLSFIFPKPSGCQSFLLNIYRIEFLLLNPLLIFLNYCKSFEPCFSFSLYLLSGHPAQCSQDWEGRFSAHPLRTHAPCLLHALPFHSIPSLSQILLFSSCPVLYRQPSPVHSADCCQVHTCYMHEEDLCQNSPWLSPRGRLLSGVDQLHVWRPLLGLSMTVTMLPLSFIYWDEFQISVETLQ